MYWIQVALVSMFLLGITMTVFGLIVLISHKLPEFKQRRADKRILKLAEEYRNGIGFSKYYTRDSKSHSEKCQHHIVRHRRRWSVIN